MPSCRSSIGAIALAAAWWMSPAVAQVFDFGKYPDLKGQWVRIGAPRWDTSKPELAQDHKERARRELRSAKLRAFLALLLASPAAVLAMSNIELPWAFFGHNVSVWIQAVLSTVVILVLGWQFHVGMLRQARTLSANMDTLISLGTLAALFFSVWAMRAGEHHLYFETGAVIAALILLGRYFEARSRGQASEAIEKLVELGVLAVEHA